MWCELERHDEQGWGEAVQHAHIGLRLPARGQNTGGHPKLARCVVDCITNMTAACRHFLLPAASKCQLLVLVRVGVPDDLIHDLLIELAKV